MTRHDARFMAHALALGRRGLGQVAPWPSVGCVIVRGGRVVGRGRSDRVTMRHAERVALDQAGDLARGATVYVTLEPCAHHGNTPPCADALIAASVARVVVAAGDPNPLVAGAGLRRLRAAGIAVTEGVGAAEAGEDHRGFLTLMRDARPMVTLKLAASLDGRIATATGESRWITGPQSRRLVHGMRLDHDAVMVGGGTARADDPELTVRGFGDVLQPTRIVASRGLNLSDGGRLAGAAGPLWLLHGDRPGDVRPGVAEGWAERGARLVPVAVARGGQLDPAAIVAALGRRGLTRVLCEGGGQFAASLLQAGLVDRLVLFSGGLTLGAEGQPAIGALGLDRLDGAPRFRLVRCARAGGDVVQYWGRA